LGKCNRRLLLPTITSATSEFRPVSFDTMCNFGKQLFMRIDVFCIKLTYHQVDLLTIVYTRTCIL